MWTMITGIKNVGDAKIALNLGADALGLLVKQTDVLNDGFISLEVAISITKELSLVSQCSPSFRIKHQQKYQSQFFSLPMDNLNSLPNPPEKTKTFCESVLVTHLIDVQKIITLAGTIDVTTILLAGSTTPEDIIDIKNSLPYIKVIKSLYVIDNSCMEYVKKYMRIADAIELDTVDIATGRSGGTGKTHDWTISQRIVQEYGDKVPIILAGGLRHDNIEKAIHTVKPFGIDVISGVKNSGGIHNEMMELLVSKAKGCKYECT